MALAVGLVPFTIQYLCLRAFYALEDNRTTFFLQCLIAGANVAFAVAAVYAAGPAVPGGHRSRPRRTPLAYLIGVSSPSAGCAASCPT